MKRSKVKRKKVMLIITEKCNMDCIYCYERKKINNNMSFEVAKSIIDNIFSNLVGYDDVTLELHGGEPFINFNLIKKIDDYVLKRYKEYNPVYRLTTNGTLVHGEIQEWLSDRKGRYEVMLSLDGNQVENDKNRKKLSIKQCLNSLKEKKCIGFNVTGYDEKEVLEEIERMLCLHGIRLCEDNILGIVNNHKWIKKVLSQENGYNKILKRHKSFIDNKPIRIDNTTRRATLIKIYDDDDNLENLIF